MKITVCIASRGRTAALIGVVMAAHRLKSGDHQVDFVLGLDDDDPDLETVRSVLEGSAPVSYSIGPAPVTRGEVENRMMRQAYAQGAEAVTLLTDRTFVISTLWDEVLARGHKVKPNRVLWWSSPEDPGCVMPIVPRLYMEAIDCEWDQCIHPFWWSDTYQQEIDLMLHGLPSLKVNAFYSGTRSFTQNGRDFPFWLEVFRATRPRRRRQALEIAHRLKIVMPDQGPVERYFAKYDETLAKRCEEFQASFGDTRDPTERYVVAKNRAMALLDGGIE